MKALFQPLRAMAGALPCEPIERVGAIRKALGQQSSRSNSVMPTASRSSVTTMEHLRGAVKSFRRFACEPGAGG